MKWAIMYRFFAQKITKAWFLGLFLCIMLINAGFGYFMNPIIEQSGGKAQIMDLQFGFKPADYYTWLDLYGESGRNTYFWVSTILDTIYPIVYTFLFILILVALLEYSYPKLVGSLYKWTFVPVLILVVDLIENSINARLLLAYPKQMEGLAKLLSGANQLKWVLVLFVFTGVIIGLLALYANGKEAKKELNKYE